MGMTVRREGGERVMNSNAPFKKRGSMRAPVSLFQILVKRAH
ncbi:uncharacterized protein G2W53_029020 [Senna tora]|uniref:Uncharacterized protein n=1 Tax=Senna tora TaxID=362788 RepID=A0A834T4P1_9FABA|nr:uncharacterized protein G2W53_029020 [Senna tora]